MSASHPDLTQIRVYPLATRRSLSDVQDILIDPESPPGTPDESGGLIAECARRIEEARQNGSAILLMYGAHLLRNGATLILQEMMKRGWISHLATNGAGSIHDWEYAYLGRSTEDVRENVEAGTFGTWDETGRYIHLALLAGGLRAAGYGEALGRFILEDGADFPPLALLEKQLADFPGDPGAPARADLLQVMRRHNLSGGRTQLKHPWKHSSIIGQAFNYGIPLTVHPGIGYDIISNHPMFNGAVIGRAAQIDFQRIAASVDQLDGGVVLSIGSAIMAPQVFEKSLSCVNNLRRQSGRAIVKEHSIYVVDLQDGGNWDWSKGEPPKNNPAYYLRFCKSFSRMGGSMHYLSCDNLTFIQHLYHHLRRLGPNL